MSREEGRRKKGTELRQGKARPLSFSSLALAEVGGDERRGEENRGEREERRGEERVD